VFVCTSNTNIDEQEESGNIIVNIYEAKIKVGPYHYQISTEEISLWPVEFYLF